MMVKRVYFGNWLRDYSQAVDVGSLKGVQAPTIRVLVSLLRHVLLVLLPGNYYMYLTAPSKHDVISFSLRILA